MSSPTISGFDLVKKSSENLSLLHGDPAVKVTQVSAIEHPIAGSLCFASTPELATKAVNAKIALLIVPKNLKLELATGANICVLQAKQMNLAMAEALSYFEESRRLGSGQIHPTAVVAKSARLGDRVSLGAYVVIGENSEIGSNTRLDAHVVIGSNCRIGKDSWLHAHAVIEDECLVGDRCEVHCHSTIGSDGFGYAQKADKSSIKIPQIGKVVLEDDVEVGANCAIDRATLSETRIGRGTKLDNHVHIAHNCSVGPHSLIAAGFMMAGSSHLGSHFMVGGGSVVTDHVTVCDNVSVGGFSAVTKDILEAGAYTGYPLEKWKDGLRTLSNLTNLTEMRRQLGEIVKKLEIK